MRDGITFLVEGILPGVWGSNCLLQLLEGVEMNLLYLSNQEGEESNDFQNKKGLYVNIVTCIETC